MKSDHEQSRGLTPYETGRLVQSVKNIQEDVAMMRKDIHRIAVDLDKRVRPLENFHNRIIGAVILIPTVISLIGVAVAWVA